MKAIEIAAAALTLDAKTAGDADAFFRQQADALVHLAQAFIKGGGSNSSTADHYQATVLVDESALRGDGGKSDLPVETVRRIARDASVVTVVEDGKGNPLSASRKTKVVSLPMKHVLLGRDKGCRFPGCSRDKWLDAQHVMHWAGGGETSMENILLLYSPHHTVLDEGGFTIQKNFTDEWCFRNGDGKALPELPSPRYSNPSRDGCPAPKRFHASDKNRENQRS